MNLIQVTDSAEYLCHTITVVLELCSACALNKCKKAYMLTPCYVDINERFLVFGRIYPPEYFKDKYGGDEAYHVDEVKISAVKV